ncbi:hypothetical protein RUM43_008857 [Polyplax serrata]|uniref:Uncharacterized protein n=1 Tax=Polyplax serrata TaxID=468196 RepID=A0AAN8NND9_POLSC
MNDPPSQVISVRAIEDIIQIQKLFENSPNLKGVHKDRSQERVVFSILKHDVYSPESPDNPLNCMLKECDIENSFKCKDKTCKRFDTNCWDRDCGFTEYVNPDVVVLENFGIIENTNSEADVKCWSSDSDITILRVRKEFRNELSNKVEWEKQRNLDDDASLSSFNLDWESHSLINLAGVTSRDEDMPEDLTPFTIWSKVKNDTRNSSMIFVENPGSLNAPYEPCTPEVRLTVENDTDVSKKIIEKTSGLTSRKKRFRRFFRSTFGCFRRNKKSLH